MKFIKFLLLTLILVSCGPLEFKWTNYGKLNNVRIDDDAEYHFDTDYQVYSDIKSNYVIIERKNIKEPYFYKKEGRCPYGKSCIDYDDTTWVDAERLTFIVYKLVLPTNYKIETFND